MDPNVPPSLPVLPPLATQAAPPYAAPPYLPPPIRALPVGAGRPGIISAMGTMSIIVASISILASLVTGCQSMLFQKIGQVSRTMSQPRVVVNSGGAMPVQNAPSGDASLVVGPEFTAGDHGLAPDNRAVVVGVLTEKRPMGPQRLRQLDAFLADQGQTAFPTGGSTLTPTGVRASVTGDSEYAGNGENDPGHTEFITNWGTLKIYDAKATFINGTETTEVSADEIAGRVAPANSTTDALTPAQVQTIVARVQKTSGNKLSAAQMASLTTLLKDPNQQLITHANSWSPIRAVTVNEGNVMVWFSDGFVTLDPQGQSQVNPMNNKGPQLKISSKACSLVALDALASMALAAFLMFAGISMLRQSPGARRFHVVYALVKIPLAILGTIAVVGMNYQFYSSAIAAGGGAVGQATTMAQVIGVLVGLGVVYPVALLLALQTRGARDYFRAARA
jgi:hypothetical protein